MQTITAKTEWTPVSKTISARIWDGRVYRKEMGEQFYGGHQIKAVVLDSPLGREWLDGFGHLKASCSPDVVDWLDPTGSLRRAGLLFVA